MANPEMAQACRDLLEKLKPIYNEMVELACPITGQFNLISVETSTIDASGDYAERYTDYRQGWVDKYNACESQAVTTINNLDTAIGKIEELLAEYES